MVRGSKLFGRHRFDPNFHLAVLNISTSISIYLSCMRLNIQFLTPFSETLHEPLTLLWCVCMWHRFSLASNQMFKMDGMSNIQHWTSTTIIIFNDILSCKAMLLLSPKWFSTNKTQRTLTITSTNQQSHLENEKRLDHDIKIFTQKPI